jgi:alpha-beta hydrolase superfamily lysophospholipase
MKLLKNLAYLILCLVLLLWLYAFWNLHTAKHQYTQLTVEQKAEASDYLEGKLTPIPIEWTWNTFTPESGVNLRTGMVDSENARGTVIVVPGFTASIEMIMREITQINAAGYRVAAIEYRGQGESYRPLAHPEKGYVESYDQLGSELATFANQIRIQNKPLFFYSISKGAHITMRMAADQEIDVNAYALIVPMIKINTGSRSDLSIRLLSGVFNTVGLGKMYAPSQSQWPGGSLEFGKPIGCNANPDTAQTREALFANRENLRTNGTTIRWVSETQSSTRYLRQKETKARIDKPIIMFTAGIDELVDTQAAQSFCRDLTSCEVVHFADSRHCITRENFSLYDQIIIDAISHFDQHL